MKKSLLRWLLSACLAGGIPFLPSCSLARGMEGAGRGWQRLGLASLGPGVVAIFKALPGRDKTEGAPSSDVGPSLRLALGFRSPRLPFGWRCCAGFPVHVACLDWGMPSGPWLGVERKEHK